MNDDQDDDSKRTPLELLVIGRARLLGDGRASTDALPACIDECGGYGGEW